MGYKIEVKGIKIEADTAKDAVVLFDKVVQYLKMLDFPNDTLLHCIECGSFDIDMISPTMVNCNLCGAEMELVDDEMIIDVELEEEDNEET